MMPNYSCNSALQILKLILGFDSHPVCECINIKACRFLTVIHTHTPNMHTLHNRKQSRKRSESLSSTMVLLWHEYVRYMPVS